jgi:hypothetical protein
MGGSDPDQERAHHPAVSEAGVRSLGEFPTTTVEERLSNLAKLFDFAGRAV